MASRAADDVGCWCRRRATPARGCGCSSAGEGVTLRGLARAARRASTPGGGGSTRSARSTPPSCSASAPRTRAARPGREHGAGAVLAGSELARAGRPRAARGLPPRRHAGRARRAHRAVPRRGPHSPHWPCPGRTSRSSSRCSRRCSAVSGSPAGWWAALAVLVLFGTMTRWEPSVLRAIAMASIALVAGYLGRPTAGLRVLALAAIVLLVADPFLLHSVGFLLSCGASLGIAVLARPIADRLPRPGVDARGARGHRGRADRRRAGADPGVRLDAARLACPPTSSRCRSPRRSRCGGSPPASSGGVLRPFAPQIASLLTCRPPRCCTRCSRWPTSRRGCRWPSTAAPRGASFRWPPLRARSPAGVTWRAAPVRCTRRQLGTRGGTSRAERGALACTGLIASVKLWFAHWLRTNEDVPAVDVAVRLYRRDREGAGSVVGSAIVFRLFLFFVPFSGSGCCLAGRRGSAASSRSTAARGMRPRPR